MKAKAFWKKGLVFVLTLTFSSIFSCGGGGGGGGGGDDPPPATCVDNDYDGYGANCDLGSDCDDADPNNWFSCSYCKDTDNDGWYVGCDAYITIQGPDLNDNNNKVYPGATEICDGLDNDGNPSTLDGSGETPPLNSKQAGICSGSRKTCSGFSGWQDDYSSVADYESTETKCDGLDNDCDGVADEGCSCIDNQTRSCYTGPEGTEGVGICQAGIQTCSGGQWGSCEYEVTPITQTCNDPFTLSDDDCNGLMPIREGTILKSFNSPAVDPMGLGWQQDVNQHYLWVSVNSTPKGTIYKITTSGAIVSGFNCPYSVCTTFGIEWDGSSLWSVDTAPNPRRVYQFSSAGSLLSSFTFSSGIWGLAWDGSNLWGTNYSSSLIYKLTTTGTVLSSFSSSAAWPRDMAFSNVGGEDFLWVASDYDNSIYKLDLSGNVIDSFSSPGSNPTGMTWDGAYLWHADASLDKIYKINPRCTEILPASELAINYFLAGRLGLKWVDNSDNEEEFWIIRDGSLVGRVPYNTTTFEDSTIQKGVLYSYRVYAYNSKTRMDQYPSNELKWMGSW